MKLEPALYSGLERRAPSREEVIDLVRARLARGFEADSLPGQLEAELDLDRALTREALTLVQDELEEAAKRHTRRRLVVIVGVLGALGALSLLAEGSWGAGLMLVVLAAGLGSMAVAFVVSQIVTGSR